MYYDFPAQILQPHFIFFSKNCTKVQYFFDMHKKSASFVKILHLTITSFHLACSLPRPKKEQPVFYS